MVRALINMDWLRRRFRPPAPAEPPAPPPLAAQHLAAARAALHAADGREALRQIALGIEADPGYLPLYRLVATTYALLPTGQNEWRLYAAPAERPNDPQAFYELGRLLSGTPSHRTAVPLLERALALAPGDAAIARALAVALLGAFRPREAYERLSALDLGDDLQARFLLQHARFLCGETEGIREYVESERPQLSERLAGSAEGAQREELEELQGLVERLDQLEESLLRRATVPEPDGSIRTWHFIQYGAAVLHVNEGPESGEGRSGGRYGDVALSAEDVDRMVARLVRLLEALERVPEVIVALSDTDSLRAAEAVAKAAGVPLEALPSPLANRSTRQMIEDVERERVLLARPRSLVVAADNRRLDAYPAFQTALPGQTVFALTHHWPAGALLTPDVSGVLCQSCVFSWTTPVREPAAPAPRTRLSEPEPPVRAAPRKKEAPPEPGNLPDDPAAFDAALAFYRERGELLKGGSGVKDRRWRFRRDSPVTPPGP